jgi:hypothetical protein
MRDGPWRTHMARLAATDYRADWIINTDADEFWMPRGATLKEVFFDIPETHGVVFALSRHFVPRPDDGSHFSDRMVVRASPRAAIHDPTSPYRPHLKAAHRADPSVTISFGSHTVTSQRWRPLHHWHPADVLHFPFRSVGQWENKGSRRARGDKPLGQYVAALQAKEAGRGAERFRGLVVDDDALQRGLASGSLELDTRLRDARRSTYRADGELDGARRYGASYLSDSAAIRDADVVRLHRRLDGLSSRVGELE